MRVLVLSDIHSNFTALEAVLKDAGLVDEIWCLGDIVGYGPNPNQCVETIRALPNITCLSGNHDLAALDAIDTSGFNPEARQSVDWTRKMLTEENQSYLASLSSKYTPADQVTIAHASPRRPVVEYLLDTYQATINFDHFDTTLCFVGHSHIPLGFYLNGKEKMATLEMYEQNVPTPLKDRTIVNPGSVGQPRDRDPRAAYALFETETNTWEQRRVFYDVEETQRRLEEVDAPLRTIYRLKLGI